MAWRFTDAALRGLDAIGDGVGDAFAGLGYTGVGNDNLKYVDSQRPTKAAIVDETSTATAEKILINPAWKLKTDATGNVSGNGLTVGQAEKLEQIHAERPLTDGNRYVTTNNPTIIADYDGTGEDGTDDDVIEVPTSTRWQSSVVIDGIANALPEVLTLTIKRSLLDPDSRAVFIVRLTLPASPTDGLQWLKGETTVAGQRPWASLVITSNTVGWTFLTAAMDEIADNTRDPHWMELNRWVGGERDRLFVRRVSFVQAVHRGTESP